jgi:hypothetical protein
MELVWLVRSYRQSWVGELAQSEGTCYPSKLGPAPQDAEALTPKATAGARHTC